MVKGLDRFREYFADHACQYVIIGGTACDILLNEIGAPFRATKDFDIVLIMEALNPSFFKKFRQFIDDGGYEHKKKSSGAEQFYRFEKPSASGFPQMVELFSRKAEGLDLDFGSGLTPICIEDSIVSLSAILLDDAYYDALMNGKKVVDGVSVIEIETVILFKIRAWNDLKSKRMNGEVIHSSDIKKHKNDVFRLLANVMPSTRMDPGDGIRQDIKQFIEEVQDDRPDLKNLGIYDTSFEEMIGLLKAIYSVE